MKAFIAASRDKKSLEKIAPPPAMLWVLRSQIQVAFFAAERERAPFSGVTI
jgi:hypothetical protein